MIVLVRRSAQYVTEVVVLGFIAIVLVLAERVGWNAIAVRAAQQMLVPFSSKITSTIQFVEGPLFHFTTLYDSAAELSALKIQHAQALAELSELDRLKLENKQLRSMMENRHISLNQRVIAAPVVSYAYPAVAVGSAQGIQSGALVIVADTVVGRVVSVSDQESRVTLLSSQDSQPVLAQTESGLQGLVQGNGKGVVLTQLQPNARIIEGERVTTIGQPGIKPGLFVGVISADTTEVTAPVKTVPLDQLVSFYTTPLVEIW